MSALTFWVLIAVSVSGNEHSMVAQQFISESACKEAKTFIEDKRGSFVFAKCIHDTAPTAEARARTQEREVRP